MWEKYNPSLSPVKATFGTWTDGEDYTTASYFEKGHVRVEEDGDVTIMTDEEWLAALDALKDMGWYKSSGRS